MSGTRGRRKAGAADPPQEAAAIAALVPPELQTAFAGIMTIVHAVHPSVTTVCWPRLRIASFGIGPSKQREHYAYVAVHARHLNLGLYHGNVLESRELAIEGTGKRLRHVRITTLGARERRGIRALLQAALAERRRAVGSG